jgi:hypothetical protein
LQPSARLARITFIEAPALGWVSPVVLVARITLIR